MARHLIQNTTTGDTRIVGDAALPFFPGYIIKDTLEDGQPPFQYYSGGESDLRYVNVSELSDPESAPSVALRAALVAGRVYNNDGSANTTKKLHVKLTADGLDIDDLIIEDVA